VRPDVQRAVFLESFPTHLRIPLRNKLDLLNWGARGGANASEARCSKLSNQWAICPAAGRALFTRIF